MREQPTITTDRLVLRPFEPEDADDLERLGNDPDVLSGATRSDVPVPGTGRFWIEHRMIWYEKGEALDFAITLRNTGDLMGAIGLGLEYPGHDAMQLSFWLGQEFWGNGYATEAARAVIPFGFANLKLHRIFARHFAGNDAAGHVLKKAGMTYEGTLRGAFKRNGIYEDLACYAVLKTDAEKTATIENAS